MELAGVERALRRPAEYFFEDGLWEMGAGLWIGLTVALPQAIGGAVANWAPVVMLLTGALGLRPAVQAAKGRWVYPRTGHVSYPGQEAAQRQIALELSPATGSVLDPAPGRRTALLLPILLGTTAAVFMGAMVGVSRRPGFGDAGAHLTIGAFLGACLLAASRRWRQRRWIALALVLTVLGAAVALSGMEREWALAAHAAGIAGALVVSGSVAIMAYRRRTRELQHDADGR